MAYENAEKFGQEAMDSTVKSLSAMTRGFQQIALENGEFAKRSVEQSTQMAQKFAQVRGFDQVVELQKEYVKSTYELWTGQATKMGDLCTQIARDTYKPFEKVGFVAVNQTADAARQG